MQAAPTLHNAWHFWQTAVITLVLSACIGESPEEKLRAAQGKADDGNEEHRPGQPCLVCHGADYSPGEEVFVLAGTIYAKVDDPDKQGLEGAVVQFEDSAEHSFSARTNRVGNFMVRVKSDESVQRQRSKGRLNIPWQPVFPLSVTVFRDAQDTVGRSMQGLIWREGSCAACHYSSEAGVDHVAKVSAEELK